MKEYQIKEMGKTKSGEKLVLTLRPKPDKMGRHEGTWGVWIQKVNYVRGKNVPSWSYIVLNVDEDEARKVFKRRNNG